MTDYFALLNEPRRAWVDPGALKQKFLTLTAQSHPDHLQQGSEREKHERHERYTELNAAYNCLRHPKERLLHFLELERGAKPSQVENIPPDLMDLFLEVSQLCRQADAFLAEKAAVTSPLLQVQMFERAQEWTQKLTTLLKQLNARQEKLTTALKDLDAAWA